MDSQPLINGMVCVWCEMDIFDKFLIVVAVISLPIAAILVPIRKIRASGKRSPLVDERLNFPGESLRNQLSDLLDDIVVCLVIALILIVVLISGLLGGVSELPSGLPIVVICCGLIAYASWKLKVQFSSALNYKLGLDGEEYTGQQLTLLLKDGADVFHDVPYKYGNIDHVVVGYDKVFAIETKAVRKPAKTAVASNAKNYEVMFDGEKLHFPTFKTAKPVEQAQLHAKWLHEHLNSKLKLEVQVIPVVALPGWFVKSSKAAQSSTLVCNPKGGFLRSHLGNSASAFDGRATVVDLISELVQVGAPKSKITDPDAQKYFDRWNRRVPKQTVESRLKS